MGLKSALILAAVPLAVACTPDPEPNPMIGPTQQARTIALDVEQTARADIELTEVDTGVRMVVRGYGLSAGVHGVHIHQFGHCEGTEFESAGPHWNPLDRQHGRDNPAGQHLGDLPNLIIGEDGTGVLEGMVNGARIAGGDYPILDADGAAVIVHLYPDDYRTDPSGNSGARVACGVLGLVELDN